MNSKDRTHHAIPLASVACACLFSATLSPAQVAPQSTAPVPITAAILLAQMSSQFSGAKPVGSVELDGTVERYLGSTTDSGTVALTAGSNGSTKVQMNLSSGQLTETQTAADPGRACQWTGPDETVRDSSSSNCWPAVVWFLPQVSFQPLRLSSLLNVTLGSTTSDSTGSLYELQSQLIGNAVSKDPTTSALIQAQSTTHLFVDPTSILPQKLDFTVLSDSGTSAIAVEIRFSGYQTISGLMVPTRIERYLNGGLELAINVNQVSISN
jgi:hypothetical protein